MSLHEQHLDLRRIAPAVGMLAAIIEGSEDAIIAITSDAIVIGWNPGAEQLFGYTEAEIVGESVATLIPPDHRGEEREILRRILAGERISHYETERCCKDGTRLQVALTVSPLRDRDGRIVGASKIVRDITELQSARVYEARLASIIETSDDAIYTKDETGIITSWNGGAEQIYGYREDEIVGQSVAVLVPDTQRGEELHLLERILRGERIHHYETQRRRRDGEVVDVSLSLSPMTTSDGRVVGASVIGRDISERQQAARLTEQANRELRRADEIKSEFLAMASHELRTPLTAIAGFTKTMIDLEEQLSDRQRREFLHIIDRQAERLTRLVDDLLTLSKIESGHLVSSPRRTPVSLAIKQTLTEFQAEGIAVTCPEDLAAHADPDHLQHILTNYVSNAIKYGRDPIEVAAEHRDGDIVIVVSDHGQGVPEQFVPRLFGRFQRAADTSAADGSGLGLSIVRGLAAAQGGHAWYEPNEPSGSRFCLRLPVA